MPLALSQASAYISQRTSRYSILQYVEKLQETDRSGLGLLEFDGGDLRRDREASNSIMLTWQISFEHIREIRPSAAHLLSLMSFFDCPSIPCFLLRERGTSTRVGENWMKKWARAVLHWVRLETVSINPVESKQVNQNTEDEENEWDVIVLRNYSFMSITAEVTVFKMHPLVQLATQKWLMSHGRLERWGLQFINNLNGVFPSIAAGRSIVESWMALAMNVREKVFRGGHPDTLASMGNLALTYWKQGRWDEAEKLQVEVMETMKAVLPKGHPDTLASMGNLAMTYSNQGRWDEAEKLQVEAMKTSKAGRPKGHPDTLRSMNTMAFTLRDLRRR
ncbi:hypothetical protein LTR91_022651 [Friedmanniomyces endolithicus]|uniref:Kinesin light chain n=1 Tax=Friedmanniomyces endolithicus TaxID=329885 RepID=A0AAN6JYH4_9PEZI|nr:hypothetical protein LTR35_017567 [Friedmanniomyces endolithicus]KAK0268869.1 hypothetical protein LTS00_017444 [Friedmanniomyces endolithicus]KAK0302535.1 hypothetical protein LTR82_017838 [Friedmanniomyces endolithicus]KAK0954528.1 hypothetical protein LTS01_023872 [Friedmanniomyces endolithicus]KAK0955854.1 hypothetical protein LTR91_022651 [Friedmanniomyces endolithicus]